MKRIKLWVLFSTSLALMIGSMGCFGAVVPYEEIETRTESNIATIKSFSLTNVSGIVKVSTGASTEIRVDAIKRVESNTRADAKTHIGEIKVKTSVSGDTFKVETEQPSGNYFQNYSVDYTVALPDALKVTLSNSNGDVEVSNIRNGVDVNATNGSVKATNIVGDVKANITNGEVVVSGIQGSVEANSTNGSIEADVTMPDGGRIVMATTNGSIALKIPESTSAQVEMATTNGEVSSDVPISITEGSLGRNSVKGQMGGGNGTIKLTSTNGSISIKKK
jgi:DUF4097 and DUF4098 domain-containing protein YvlB